MDTISETLEALAAAGRRAAEARDLDEALRALGEAVRDATGSDAVVIRVPDGGGRLVARTVVTRSQALAAELEGSSFPLAELPPGELSGDMVPEPIRRIAERLSAQGVLLLPVRAAGDPLGSLELLRSRGPFASHEATLARLAVSQLGLVLRAFLERNGGGPAAVAPDRTLDIAGDALVAGLNGARAADEIVRIAVGASGAAAALLWRAEPHGLPTFLTSTGRLDLLLDDFERAAERALGEQQPVWLEPSGAGPDRPLATIPLGQPPLGALQLVFGPETALSAGDLERLATFGVRAAQALRSAERTGEIALRLDRTQALLGIVGQAIAQLSLTHTVETAVARVSELLGAESVAVYLREGLRLRSPAGGSLLGPELAVAERLLELALGPMRAQGMLYVRNAQDDVRLARVRDAVEELGVDAVVALPLLAHDELIGLLTVYLPSSRELTASESTLASALASQLAVAVQNARLHERAKRLGRELEQALESEQQAARRLRALYEISRSFAQSLSLERTLAAVTRTAVELLDADAAVIRTPDEPGDQLVPRATFVAETRLAEPLRPLLEQGQPVEKLPGRRLFRMGKPLVLDPGSARRLGPSYELLAPFLEQGASAVVIPIATATELLATLTVVSLDPSRRIGSKEAGSALFVAGQAALAIDNARLYQQQKAFADTMQRSLLPALPAIAGVDIGAVYESSARVDVGGDVYDFLPLPDGRLAVILGDVIGHGVPATADMALAKFVVRSLVREHPEPGALLAQVNEVVLGEVAEGSFITMLCIAIDKEQGELLAASAGHPQARLLEPDGTVSAIPAKGLALGVEPGQEYPEVRLSLPQGGAAVLYTDGLVEARRDREAYGDERLDKALASGGGLTAQALAEHVVADCRAFAGEPADDYAVVVVRRT